MTVKNYATSHPLKNKSLWRQSKIWLSYYFPITFCVISHARRCLIIQVILVRVIVFHESDYYFTPCIPKTITKLMVVWGTRDTRKHQGQIMFKHVTEWMIFYIGITTQFRKTCRKPARMDCANHSHCHLFPWCEPSQRLISPTSPSGGARLTAEEPPTRGKVLQRMIHQNVSPGLHPTEMKTIAPKPNQSKVDWIETIGKYRSGKGVGEGKPSDLCGRGPIIGVNRQSQHLCLAHASNWNLRLEARDEERASHGQKKSYIKFAVTIRNSWSQEKWVRYQVEQRLLECWVEFTPHDQLRVSRSFWPLRSLRASWTRLTEMLATWWKVTQAFKFHPRT